MAEPISPALMQHLEGCGYKPAVKKWNAETRLFQDVGLFGDNAVDDLVLLAKTFKVDLSNFPFSKYFPGNYGREPLVLTFFWRSKWADEIRKRYPPITWGMLDAAIEQKKWPFD